MEDAKILSLLSRNHTNLLSSDYSSLRLYKAELWQEPGDPAHYMEHFKLNHQGHVIEIYIYHFDFQIIEKFPLEACALKELEVLDISGNRLTFFPDEIVSLKNLRSLCMDSYHSDSIEIPDHLISYIKSLEKYNKWGD